MSKEKSRLFVFYSPVLWINSPQEDVLGWKGWERLKGFEGLKVAVQGRPNQWFLPLIVVEK